MIKLVENLSQDTALQLSEFFRDSLCSMFVLFSILDWTNVDGVWVQTEQDDVTALVVQREMSKVYVCANDRSDFYELADFISRLGGMVVHCSSEITERLGVTAYSKISLMLLEGEIPEGRETAELNDGLRKAFDLLVQSKKKTLCANNTLAAGQLKKVTDKAYKEWLSKTSRGIFNGFTQVRAVKAGENALLSVAIADRLGSDVYIRDVATDSDFRKMGYATDCISGICRDFSKDADRVFLACNDVKTENFYKKLGFVRKEYLDIGIIEI